MKNTLIILFLWLFVLGLQAQTERAEPVSLSQDGDSIPCDTLRSQSFPLSLSSVRPLPLWGAGWWPLHEGLNAQLSLSATMGLGRNHPRGLGFGKEVNLCYVSPLQGPLNYTLGVNTWSMDWGSAHSNHAGAWGSLHFLANERLSFALMGYKDLVDAHSFAPRRYVRPDSYIGVAAGLKVTDNFFFQVSFGTTNYRY